jgi:hypothetical protein
MPTGYKVGDGYIEVRLVGPDKPDIDAMKRRVKQAAGKVEVDVGANTTEFDKKAKATESKKKDLDKKVEPKIGADDAEGQRKLANVRRILDDMQKRVVEARVGADTEAARLKLRAVELQLEKLDRKTSSPKIDLDGVATAELALIRLDRQIDAVEGSTVHWFQEANAGVSGLGGQLRNLGEFIVPVGLALVATFGPALIAMLKLAVIGVVGIAGAVGAAGIATGVFAAVFISAFSDMKDRAEALKEAQDKVADAKTTKEKTEALKELRVAQAALKGPIGEAATAYARMDATWNKFIERNSPQVYGIMRKGFDTFSAAIPQLQPLFDVAFKVFDKWAGRVEAFVRSDRFGAFIKKTADIAGPALDKLMEAGGNFLEGIVQALGGFAPVGNDFLTWLVKVSEKFEKWTESADFKKMAEDAREWANDVGPKVVDTLKGLFEIIVQVSDWLANGGREDLGTIASAFGAIGDALNWIDEHKDVFKALIAPIGVLAQPILQIIDLFKKVKGWIDDLFGNKTHTGTLGFDDRATPKLSTLLTDVAKWAGKRFLAIIGADSGDATSKIAGVLNFVAPWAGDIFTGILKAANSDAVSKIGETLSRVGGWAGKKFLGFLTGSNANAVGSLSQLLGRVGGSWLGKKFTGFLTGNNSSALSSISSTMGRVASWSGRRFLGHLTGNNSGAISVISSAVSSVRRWTRTHSGSLSLSMGNVRSVVSSALGAVGRFAGKTFTAFLKLSKLGFSAGGLVPGLASGGPVNYVSGSGRVEGPGNGLDDDKAGQFRLTRNEFVINATESKRHRPLIEAINSGVLSQAAAAAQGPAPQTSGASATIGLGTNFGDVYVSITAQDIAEMKTARDFFKYIEQAARAGVRSGNSLGMAV